MNYGGCAMWCDVECCHFRHGVMWNVIEMPQNRCDVEYGVVRNVVS